MSYNKEAKSFTLRRGSEVSQVGSEYLGFDMAQTCRVIGGPFPDLRASLSLQFVRGSLMIRV